MSAFAAHTASTTATTSTKTADQPAVTCYSVHGVASPSLMPRVAGVFARHGLTPGRWYATTHDDEVQIDVQVAGLDRRTADLLAGALRQLIEVGVVLVSTK